jgi:hypothetical protein
MRPGSNPWSFEGEAGGTATAAIVSALIGA